MLLCFPGKGWGLYIQSEDVLHDLVVFCDVELVNVPVMMWYEMKQVII